MVNIDLPSETQISGRWQYDGNMAANGGNDNLTSDDDSDTAVCERSLLAVTLRRICVTRTSAYAQRDQGGAEKAPTRCGPSLRTHDAIMSKEATIQIRFCQQLSQSSATFGAAVFFLSQHSDVLPLPCSAPALAS